MSNFRDPCFAATSLDILVGVSERSNNRNGLGARVGVSVGVATSSADVPGLKFLDICICSSSCAIPRGPLMSEVESAIVELSPPLSSSSPGPNSQPGLLAGVRERKTRGKCEAERTPVRTQFFQLSSGACRACDSEQDTDVTPSHFIRSGHNHSPTLILSLSSPLATLASACSDQRPSCRQPRRLTRH